MKIDIKKAFKKHGVEMKEIYRHGIYTDYFGEYPDGRRVRIWRVTRFGETELMVESYFKPVLRDKFKAFDRGDNYAMYSAEDAEKAEKGLNVYAGKFSMEDIYDFLSDNMKTEN